MCKHLLLILKAIILFLSKLIVIKNKQFKCLYLVINLIKIKARIELYIDQLVDFEENKTSYFECNSELTLIDLNYTWFKDNLPVNLTYLNAMVAKNRITFLNANHLAIDGSYTCSVYVESLNETISSKPLSLNINRRLLNSYIECSIIF